MLNLTKWCHSFTFVKSNNSGLVRSGCAKSGHQAENKRSNSSFDNTNNPNHHSKADGTERRFDGTERRFCSSGSWWIIFKKKKPNLQIRSKPRFIGVDLWTNTGRSPPHCTGPVKLCATEHHIWFDAEDTRETCDASALFQQRDGEEVSRRRQTAGDKRTVVRTDLGLNALWCSAGGIYAPTAAGSGCRIYLAPRDITARWDFKVKYLFEDA